MLSNQKIFLMAALYGASSVVLGAFGAHGLKDILTPESLASFKVGVQYQFWHALFLLVLYVLNRLWPSKLLRVSAGVTVLGVALFSGSIYLLATKALFVTPPLWLVLMTPLGGALMITAWVLLIVYGIKGKHE